MMILASAIAIPLTQLVFAIKPLMGPFYEKFEYAARSPCLDLPHT